MAGAIILRTLSCVFGPVEKTEWDSLVDPASWQAFLAELRELVGDDSFEDLLSTPPAFEDHRAFASKCLVGGLPTSALPVESLYFQEEGADGPRYLQKPALYMRHLIEGAGLEVPCAFVAAPDHLSLELEMAAMYLELGLVIQAKQLLRERSEWLPSYRSKLESLPTCPPFYIACVDAVVAIARAWA